MPIRFADHPTGDKPNRRSEPDGKTFQPKKINRRVELKERYGFLNPLGIKRNEMGMRPTT
jgi:hypothetical protein